MDFEGILRFWTADGGCEEKVTRDMTVHSHCRSLSSLKATKGEGYFQPPAKLRDEKKSSG